MPNDLPEPRANRAELVEPMAPEHFEIAVAALTFQSEAIVEAARSVMVDSCRPSDAAVRYDIPQPQISRVVARIERKWHQICDDHHWEYQPVALPPEVMALVRNIQASTLEPVYRQLLEKKAKRAGRQKKR